MNSDAYGLAVLIAAAALVTPWLLVFAAAWVLFIALDETGIV